MYLFYVTFTSNVLKVYSSIYSRNLKFNQLTFFAFHLFAHQPKNVVQKQKQTVKSIARTQKVIICKEIIVP